MICDTERSEDALEDALEWEESVEEGDMAIFLDLLLDSLSFFLFFDLASFSFSFST